MLSPMVSVVLCSYNGEKFIEQQIKSIQQQTYLNFEIIIQDDYSTDNTNEIIARIAKTDSRILHIINPNRLGLNKNFESAFLKATANYIAISDQDDIWEAEKITYMMNNLWTDPSIQLIYTPSQAFNDERNFNNRIKLTRLISGKNPKHFFILNSLNGHGMIFKKTLLTQLLPFPENVYYDWWICLVASVNGGIQSSEKLLTHHRRHEFNYTTLNKSTPFYLTALEILPYFLKIKNFSNNDRKLLLSIHKKCKDLKQNKFSVSLFFLILKYSPQFFYSKKRIFPIFSYMKNAYKISSKKAL